MILVFNAGSSTLKIRLYKSQKLQELLSIKIDWSASPLKRAFCSPSDFALPCLNKKTKEENLKLLFSFLKQSFPEVTKIGHRIVHGGSIFFKPTLINGKVITKLKALKKLAPLHNPIEIQCIIYAQKAWTKAMQVAVFDTSFYKDLPDSYQYFPLPLSLYQKKIKRYGFHGISHEGNLLKMQRILKKKNFKMISCHLGSGCSISAIHNQKCVDTTMGFTPLDGLIMATRPGSIDPGVLLYLLKNKIYSLEKLESILNHESGLKGISNQTEDMREILQLRKENSKAQLAFEMFTQSVAKHISALMTSLLGCDYLVFSGGIGENSPEVRKAIIRKLSFLGLELDSCKNKFNQNQISTKASKSIIWVLHSEEEKIIACKLNTLFTSH